MNKSKRRARWSTPPEDDSVTTPTLRFSPTTWAKLIYLRDLGDTEVGGFGVTDPDDLLYVRDFHLITQATTVASVSSEDDAIADFTDRMVDAGLRPEQFLRLWIHTHPGDSPLPSSVDEETFARAFGSCDWSVMAILAQDDSTYARLHYEVGPGADVVIRVAVDYSQPFDASDHNRWKQEYEKNVYPETARRWPGHEQEDMRLLPIECLEELEQLDSYGQAALLADLDTDPDWWAQA